MAKVTLDFCRVFAFRRFTFIYERGFYDEEGLSTFKYAHISNNSFYLLIFENYLSKNIDVSTQKTLNENIFFGFTYRYLLILRNKCI